MRRRAVALLLCSAAILVVAAPALGQSRYALPRGLATTSDGRAVAAYGVYPGGVVVLAEEQPDGSFAPRERTPLPPGESSTMFSLAGGDEVVGAYEHSASYGEPGTKSSGVTSFGGALFAGRPGATGFGPTLRVLPRRRTSVHAVRLAANRRGDAAVASGGFPTHVITRRAGGSFQPPAAPIALRPDAVAVDADGRATVAGNTDGLDAVTVEPDGRVGPVQRLTSERPGYRVRVAAGRGGEAVVAWSEPYGSLRMARRSGPGRRFGRPLTLAATPLDGPRGLALDDAGRALVVWMQFDGARVRYRAVAVDAGGRLGEPFWLSEPEGHLYNAPVLAANERGQVIFVWPQRSPDPGSPDGEAPFELVARTGTTAGAFDPPVVLGPRDRRAGLGFFASVAPGGRASVLWSDARVDAATKVSSDDRLQVTHLEAGRAAPPVAVAYGGPPPPVMAGVSPPLRDARAVQRVVRAGEDGRLRLQIRCESWTARTCRGVVRLRRGGRRVVARAPFAVASGAVAVVPLRLRPAAAARRGRSFRVRDEVRTTGPRGATRRRTLFVRARCARRGPCR